MPVRGIRGATTVHEDQSEAIIAATRELLKTIMAANPTLQVDDLASTIFTVTEDLSAAFPARAARDMGWDHVPLMCVREIPVQEACHAAFASSSTGTPIYLKHR